jgi:hypothetical protein
MAKQDRQVIRSGCAPDRKKRGQIQEFSQALRRRMVQWLAKVRLDETPPLFGTTTY